MYVEAMNRAMKVHALEPFLPIRVACDICEGRNQKVEVPIGRAAICTFKVKRRICDIPVPVSLGLPNRERVELSFYASLPLGWLIGCVPFGESKNGFLILDLPDFSFERNVKSEIGFVNLVTFRQRVQYARQPLKKWRVFYCLTNYAIIPCRI